MITLALICNLGCAVHNMFLRYDFYLAAFINFRTLQSRAVPEWDEEKALLTKRASTSSQVIGKRVARQGNQAGGAKDVYVQGRPFESAGKA